MWEAIAEYADGTRIEKISYTAREAITIENVNGNMI